MKQEYRTPWSSSTEGRRDREVPQRDNRLWRAHPLLYVSIMLQLSCLVLLAGNLLLSGSIIRRLSVLAPPSPVAAEPNLPPELDDLARQRLFAEVQALYNEGDFAALYDRFDDYAKVQMDREQTIADLASMSELFQKLEEGVYSRFETVGPHDGREFYNLYYQAKILTPEGSRPGEVRIGVLRDNGKIGIVEFNVSASQQAAPTD